MAEIITIHISIPGTALIMEARSEIRGAIHITAQAGQVHSVIAGEAHGEITVGV